MRFLLGILLMSCAGSAFAQVASSSLIGVVTDPSSAAVFEAKVTARHEATGFARTTLTGAAGQFRIDHLIPGSYRITAGKPGFKTQTTSAVVLEINQKGRVDLQLQLGAASDSVAVEASASPVASDDASMGYRLHSATVLSLPLATRDVASLVTLGAGAVPRQLGGTDLRFDRNRARSMVVPSFPGGRDWTIVLEDREPNAVGQQTNLTSITSVHPVFRR